MKRKVLAAVTREHAGQTQVLVFTHRHAPEAGVQIPAGTVDAGEDHTTAAWRELAEESGLRPEQVTLVGHVFSRRHPDWGEAGIEENLYHFTANGPLPATWAHTVYGQGDDEGYLFDYYWIPLLVPLVQWEHRIPPWLSHRKA